MNNLFQKRGYKINVSEDRKKIESVLFLIRRKESIEIASFDLVFSGDFEISPVIDYKFFGTEKRVLKLIRELEKRANIKINIGELDLSSDSPNKKESKK